MPLGIEAFDLDGTLIEANISFRFGSYLFCKKFFKPLELIRPILYYSHHKFLQLPLNRLHQKTFRSLFKGRSIGPIRLHAEQFIDRHLDAMLYSPTLRRLQEAQKDRHTVVAIFSSSPDFLVAPIAKKLGVGYWIGSTYRVDSVGQFTEIPKVIQGEDKADLLQKMAQFLGVELCATTVYSDSILDLPFLQVGGSVVAVQPDRKLKALSLQRGWKII